MRKPRIMHPRKRFPDDEEGFDMWWFTFIRIGDLVFQIAEREGST